MKNIKDLIKNIQNFDFKASYKNERDPIIKVKFLALHHLQSGKQLKDVAEMLLYDEKALRNWIRAFVEFDYEGLIIRKGRGRKPRLPKDQEESFADEIDKIQEDKNGGRITVDDIQKLLLQAFPQIRYTHLRKRACL